MILYNKKEVIIFECNPCKGSSTHKVLKQLKKGGVEINKCSLQGYRLSLHLDSQKKRDNKHIKNMETSSRQGNSIYKEEIVQVILQAINTMKCPDLLFIYLSVGLGERQNQEKAEVRSQQVSPSDHAQTSPSNRWKPQSQQSMISGFRKVPSAAFQGINGIPGEPLQWSMHIKRV